MTHSTVVVGNPKPGSRTLGLATDLATRLTGSPPDETVDLALLADRLFDWGDQQVTDAVKAVQNTDLLVVASPTFKGSYTGLLKAFLDRFGAGSLHGIPTIAVMVGGDRRHALAPEVFLKPVLSEIGASLPASGLFVIEAELTRPETRLEWLEETKERLGRLGRLDPGSADRVAAIS